MKTEIVVRKYGLLPPPQMDDRLIEHARKMQRLYNTCVEIEQAQREQYFELMGEDGGVAVIEEELATLYSEQANLKAAKKAQRTSLRSKKLDDPLRERRLAELRDSIRAKVDLAKEARRKAREKLKPKLDALEAYRRKQVKAARQTAAADGLWWPNYNATLERFERARQTAMKTGGKIRFQAFTGEFTFTFQVQGGMSVPELMGGKMWQVGVAPLKEGAFTHPSRGEQRRRQRTTFHIAITGTGENGPCVLRVPMIMHRPIPSDLRVKSAQLKRVKEGGRMRWYAIIMATREVADEPLLPRGSKAAGLDTGWRMRPDGSLRVGMLTFSGETPQELVLPAKWMQSMDAVEAETGRVDDLTNDMLAKLAAFIDQDIPAHSKPWPMPQPTHRMSPEWLARIRQVTTNKKSRARALGRLQRDWAKAWPHIYPSALEALSAWSQQDLRTRRRIANRRARLIRRRKDLYRVWVADIAATAGAVAINRLSLKSAARVDMPDGSDPVLSEPVRAMRFRAALSDLRMVLSQSTAREGITIIESPTDICRKCGQDPQPAERSDLIWSCRHCGEVFDQDENASHVLLAAAMADTTKTTEHNRIEL